MANPNTAGRYIYNSYTYDSSYNNPAEASKRVDELRADGFDAKHTRKTWKEKNSHKRRYQYRVWKREKRA